MEAVRQPVCLLLSATCVLLTAIIPLVLMHNLGEDGRIARDSGLAFHLVFGLFISGYAACSSLSREMHSGTAAVVLSKPVDRALFFLAKYAGVAVLVFLFSACACISTLLAERTAERFISDSTLLGYVTDWQTGKMLIGAPFVAFLLAGIINYRWKKSFQSSAFFLLFGCLVVVLLVSGLFDQAGRWAPYSLHIQHRIVPGGILVTLALLVLAAIALAFSTRLSIVPTMTLTGAFFVMGLLSDHWFGKLAAESAVGRCLYGIVPNWQNFWCADYLARGGTIPMGVLWGTAVYALAYSGAVLCLGVLSFRSAEIK